MVHNGLTAVEVPVESRDQDRVYRELAATFGAALDRLARAYEADAEKFRDLRQEIHLALWRSLAGFDGRCSLRTWVYRVAHNVAITHVQRSRRARAFPLSSLESLESEPVAGGDAEADANRSQAVERLMALIHKLNPLDRQIMLLYLEDVDAASIAEITGISAGNVATRIHRIKNLLARRFHEGRTP